MPRAKKHPHRKTEERTYGLDSLKPPKEQGKRTYGRESTLPPKEQGKRTYGTRTPKRGR